MVLWYYGIMALNSLQECAKVIEEQSCTLTHDCAAISLHHGTHLDAFTLYLSVVLYTHVNKNSKL